MWQKMIPNKGGERKDCDPSQVNFANAAGKSQQRSQRPCPNTCTTNDKHVEIFNQHDSILIHIKLSNSLRYLNLQPNPRPLRTPLLHPISKIPKLKLIHRLPHPPNIPAKLHSHLQIHTARDIHLYPFYILPTPNIPLPIPPIRAHQKAKRIRHIALRVSDFQIPRPDVDVERIRRRWSGWARARR
ncbi:hypothetical protein HBI38_181040 [Parastagonospora nodorum]|nr:hypothetical protein HBH69_184620 [Parastagonospora nodorum]KAH5209641.1 hypothetical protein HBI62_213180 [Parastagonospora nodorum]KAH6139923.1 hypothetical protein HBI63_208650 [Parastagonospora nodorum]KAH6201584.1 hypothetical protein HBI15_186140 [Parastagonospora nodorum]KAH6309933.1 hypothetical protein HBI38_181040 [Parastagonospora nodorum]